MKTPADTSIVFTFGSHPTKKLEWRWQAKLTFPPAAGPETILPLSIVDGRGQPIETGTFEFAGQRLKVANGAASLTYDEFIRGKHEVALWLYRPGILPIPGGLTFA